MVVLLLLLPVLWVIYDVGVIDVAVSVVVDVDGGVVVIIVAN